MHSLSRFILCFPFDDVSFLFSSSTTCSVKSAYFLHYERLYSLHFPCSFSSLVTPIPLVHPNVTSLRARDFIAFEIAEIVLWVAIFPYCNTTRICIISCARFYGHDLHKKFLKFRESALMTIIFFLLLLPCSLGVGAFERLKIKDDFFIERVTIGHRISSNSSSTLRRKRWIFLFGFEYVSKDFQNVCKILNNWCDGGRRRNSS